MSTGSVSVSFLERSFSQDSNKRDYSFTSGESDDRGIESSAAMVHGDERNESSSPRKMSLFTIYAKIFRLMLARWVQTTDPNEEKHLRELEELVLPSNEEWRRQVYYRLVDLQREIDAEGDVIEMESDAEKDRKDIKEWEWQPSGGGYPLRPKGVRRNTSVGSWEAIISSNGSMTEACIQPGWRVGDLILAAQVLQKQSSPPTYSDEAEMRRVFGLVYDVLRYKNILNHALEDVGFWYHNPECKRVERIVWLLLYDMQGRKFGRRGEVNEVAAREKAFEEAGIKEIEDALLKTKTRLAASVSRLRIGGSALNLGTYVLKLIISELNDRRFHGVIKFLPGELLPHHLRTAEGVVWGENGAVASGWVNTLKISGKEEFIQEMTRLGLNLCTDCSNDELDEGTFLFDPMCPKVVNFHDAARETIAKSDLVKNYQFVFLERSLCLGAAALAQAVRMGHLCGPVVLTHVIAPRHTGYLAGLLADIDDAGRLLAFGTGQLRRDYETYLRNLGVTLQQCRVFSESYTSPPPSAELERATIVLATPPSSYTGVRDAVDLAVARGGDTFLLESLTDIDGGLRQPQTLLAEQLHTLRHALTRPNVQLLIYEAQSVLPTETTEMVEQVTQYANRMAVEKYVREHSPKRKILAKDGASRSARSGKSSKRNQQSLELPKPQSEDRRSGSGSIYDEEDETSISPSIEDKVPDSDLFEFGHVDEVCGKSTEKLMDRGCYLALIRRKEMMQFNSLFMIKVAEAKGLFGDPNKQPAQPKEEQQPVPVRQGSQQSRKGCKRNKIQMERIAAPTFSSMVRNFRQTRACPRHSHHVAHDERISLEQDRPHSTGTSALESNQQFEFICSRKCHGYVHDGAGDKKFETVNRRQLESQQHQVESVKRLSTPTHSSMKRTRSKYCGNTQGNCETLSLPTATWHIFKFHDKASLKCEYHYERNDQIYKTILQGVHYAV